MSIPNSELILHPNGSIYHLNLLPQQLADKIILVGDPHRVATISSFFSSIDTKVEHREFVTHTGVFNNQRISVVATGIGTDNIDIVINELDALVNIDLVTREIKNEKKSLQLVRIGTCGALHEHLGVDNFILSQYAIGLDNLLYYYKDFATILEHDMMQHFQQYANIHIPNFKPYIVQANTQLVQKLQNNTFQGITLTAPGFYAPQGRTLRLNPFSDHYHQHIAQYEYQNHKILNFEMETSALFGLSKLLGHHAATICLIVANRASKQFSKDYKKPMHLLIEKVLNDLTS